MPQLLPKWTAIKASSQFYLKNYIFNSSVIAEQNKLACLDLDNRTECIRHLCWKNSHLKLLEMFKNTGVEKNQQKINI